MKKLALLLLSLPACSDEDAIMQDRLIGFEAGLEVAAIVSNSRLEECLTHLLIPMEAMADLPAPQQRQDVRDAIRTVPIRCKPISTSDIQVLRLEAKRINQTSK